MPSFEEDERLRQAAEVAYQYFDDLRQTHKLRTVHHIVQALVELTLADLDRPTKTRRRQFTPLEVWEATWRIENAKSGNPIPEPPGEAGRWIRERWPRVQALLERGNKGLRDKARLLGLPVIPGVEKTKDAKGGAGNYTCYWLLALPRATENLGQTEDLGATGHLMPEPGAGFLPKPTLHYTRLTVRSLPGALIPWQGPWTLQGWRRWVLLLPLLVTSAGLTASITTVLMALWSALWGATVPVWQVQVGVWGIVLFAPAFGLLWPWFSLLKHRIVLAPVWLLPLTREEPFLVMGRAREGRVQDLQAPRIIQMVSYTARCPLCGGLVRVDKGKGPLRGRLVGRCDESPREHVFSFDHVLLRGHRLYP